MLEDGPLSRAEVERLDGGCREYNFRVMLVWVRGSEVAAVRVAKRDARRAVVDELESRAAPRMVLCTWLNRYGGD